MNDANGARNQALKQDQRIYWNEQSAAWAKWPRRWRKWPNALTKR